MNTEILQLFIDAGHLTDDFEPMSDAARQLLHSTIEQRGDKAYGARLGVTYESGEFQIYSGSSYICTTKSIETMLILLMLANNPSLDVEYQLFPQRLSPTQPGVSFEAQARARKLAREMLERRAAGSTADPTTTGIPEGSTVRTEGQ